MLSSLQQLFVAGRLHPMRVAVVLALLVAVHVAMYYFQLTHRMPVFAQQLVSTSPPGNVVVDRGHVTPTDSSLVVVTAADGTFAERLTQFNEKLSELRQHLRVSINTTTTGGQNLNYSGHVRVVWGAVDDYIKQLANSTDITTVALDWLHSRTNWNSLTDFANVPYQQYHEWTADDKLCTWIETPGTTRAKYDAVYGRTCSRNIDDSARPTSLRPVFLNAKPMRRGRYWPNDGVSYPAYFYTTTPPYVLYVHVHRDAVVTAHGDVITASTKLVLHACSHDTKPPTPKFSEKLRHKPVHDEVYVISQRWGTGVFHKMAEIVPRFALCLDFLKANPQIRILGPEGGGRLAELMEIIGLNSSRLVTGLTRARIVYQPRSTRCGFANVQESQLTSQLYRDYIRRTFPAQPRNRLILIRRSRSRRFTEQRGIERALERAAVDYNLTYEMFIDNPVPSLNHTMIMFHSAVIVVAPHGAGLSNLYFSQPGTYVIEGVCNRPHVNMCFQRLTHILGHRWHGLASRRGCESVVDVSAGTVELAVRHILNRTRLDSS